MFDWRMHFDDGDRISLEAGETVFRCEDDIRSVYYVVSGAVSLVRVLPNGDRLVLNEARARSLLAEASLFANFYHCDAEALGPATLLRLRKSVLIERLERAPKTSLSLLADTSREIQRLRSRIEILRLNRVCERLDAWLALNGPPAKGRWVDVASAIGVSPPALYRELARRRKQGDS